MQSGEKLPLKKLSVPLPVDNFTQMEKTNFQHSADFSWGFPELYFICTPY